MVGRTAASLIKMPSGQVDTRAQAEALTDESTLASFMRVLSTFIERLHGESWARTAAMRECFGVPQTRWASESAFRLRCRSAVFTICHGLSTALLAVEYLVRDVRPRNWGSAYGGNLTLSTA